MSVNECGDIQFDHVSNDETAKKLGELMSEYLNIKKLERENNISKLHASIRRRINALKKLQVETNQLDVEFHNKIMEIEEQFQMRYLEVFKKRFAIIKGENEPTDDELYDKEEIFENTCDELGPTGIPNFWLNVYKNVTELNTMVQEYDEPILKHLIDVRCVCKTTPELSFTLEFHFAPNEYFRNEVLTKTYFMKCELDSDDPFGFDGPEIYKTIGCEIDWNEGKDVTKLHRESEVNSFFPNSDSIFTFFNPPTVPAYDVPGYDKIEEYLESDFEIGHFIKERVIPRAVMYFLGEYDDVISSDDEGSTDVPKHIYFDSDAEETTDKKSETEGDD